MTVKCTRAEARSRQRTRAIRRLLHRRLARFGHDENGSLAIWSLFMLMMMMMVGGLGIDFMLNEMRRTQLQGTLDRAVLAAADLDQTLSPQAVVQDYFDKAGLGGDLISVTPVSGLNFRTVSAQAATESNPMLLHMLGVDKLRAPAAGTAEEVIPNTEISLVLDISGTMRWNNRMTNLKPAARDFISTVLSGDAASTTSINIVPYAGQTNPGPEMFDYLQGVRYGSTGEDHFPEWEQDISNIVIYFDRDHDDELDYAAKIQGYPGSDVDEFNKDDVDTYFESVTEYLARTQPELEDAAAAFGVSIKGGQAETEFFSVDGTPLQGDPMNTGKGPDIELNFSDFYDEVMPQVSSCLEIEESDFDSIGLLPNGRPQVPHFMNWTIAANVMDWGWCPEDDTRIQYAQNDEAALHDFITNLRMHDGTGTHYAMKWGLALLDPDTQPAFEHLSTAGQVPEQFKTRPSAWNEEGWTKVIVLMTDGQITQQVRPTAPLDPENATVELKNQPNSASQQISSASTNVQSFYDQCNLAKANGVTVYTIAFEAPSAAQQQMANCASSPAHYFNVQDLEIADAFNAIARQINQLRLTQ
jgi:Flp pilus assembly protein TadG